MLKARKSRINEKRYFFQSRVVEPWNGLPAATQQAPSLNSFKSRYDKHMRASRRTRGETEESREEQEES